MRHLLCISTLLSIVCALAIRSVPSFDDAFARNKMIVLSAAAYTDSPQQCVENRLAGNVTGINPFNCDSSNQDICASISGVVESEKAIFMAFRGSVSNQQILIETEENTFDKRVSFVGGGTVSEYFNHGFVGLWRAGLKNDFLLLTQKYPGYQLWITGHSLGAAMASLAATYINQLGMFDSAQIRLVTFGEPRVGDAGYAAEVDKLPYVYRVIHAADIVPHMPFRIMGYEHHKTEVSFVGGGTVSEYFNHGFVGLWRAGLKNDFLLLTQKYPEYQLWITGHSLGAAMASLAATYINQLGMFDPAQIRLVTFGEPRVGDAGYAAEVDKLPYVYRVIHAADIVPHMPLREMGYEHHRTEIWYNNTMAAPIFKACKAGDEDQNCSDGQWDLSMTDHRQYYERIVPEWGAAGCA